jgi:hypothetical protein
MRAAQHAMAGFLPLIDWSAFVRANCSEAVTATGFHRFASASADQAVVWLLRRNALASDGRIDPHTAPRAAEVTVPGLKACRYRITGWDTAAGCAVETFEATATGNELRFTSAPIVGDRAFAIGKLDQ